MRWILSSRIWSDLDLKLFVRVLFCCWTHLSHLSGKHMIHLFALCPADSFRLADVVRIPPARAVLLYNTCKSPFPVPIRKYLVSQRSLLAMSCRATTARVYTPSLSSQAKCSRTPTTRPERWRIRCESVLPITICDCWAKSIGCFELKRRDQRDSFSLLVLCKNKKGWKVWNFAGKVTIVIGDSSSTSQSNLSHPRMSPFSSGFYSDNARFLHLGRSVMYHLGGGAGEKPWRVTSAISWRLLLNATLDGRSTLCKMLIESVALFHYTRRAPYENVKF